MWKIHFRHEVMIRLVPLLLVVVSSIMVVMTIVAILQTVYAFVSAEQSNEPALLIDEKIIKEAIELIEQQTILN